MSMMPIIKHPVEMRALEGLRPQREPVLCCSWECLVLHACRGSQVRAQQVQTLLERLSIN